jgi:FHA domain
MPHLTYPNGVDIEAVTLLSQNPRLSDLLAKCNEDPAKVTTFLEPILNAAKRCEIAPYYIQAITTSQTTFLVTNLSVSESLAVIDSAASWLLGRSPSSAIAIANACISRQHAAIGHIRGKDFYITDVGSRNGTWVNCRRLSHLERCLLRDGDLIQIGPLKIEFFVVGGISQKTVSLDDTAIVIG